MLSVRFATLLILLSFSFPAAYSNESENPDIQEKIRTFESTLRWQYGKVTLRDGLAGIVMPKSFRYLNPDNSIRLLKAWGNEKVGDPLGMIFPAQLSPFAADGWGVIITYDKTGHIKDNDAKQIDYNKVFSEMQGALAEENKSTKIRKPNQVTLLGWASLPEFDEVTHKLLWAKELQFGSEPIHTLNYNIRILGKEGVLILNIVAKMNQLKVIEKQALEIAKFVNFLPGNTYADYKDGTHKTSTLRLADLVTGGVKTNLAIKVQNLKTAIPGLFPFKRYLIASGVVGMLLLLFVLFRKKKKVQVF